MDFNKLPTPSEITEASELAVLAVLDIALDMAGRALLSAHPELCEDRFPRSDMEKAIRAEQLFSLTFRLQSALARYRLAVSNSRFVEPDAIDDLDRSF